MADIGKRQIVLDTETTGKDAKKNIVSQLFSFFLIKNNDKTKQNNIQVR